MTTDESVDIEMEGSFPGFSACRKFHTGILIGILTMELSDGRTDINDNEHTVGQMVVLFTS